MIDLSGGEGMRRIVFAAALVAGLAALSLPCARAAEGASGSPAETEIHLNQQATRTLAPDRLRAVLRVEAKGASGRQVQADVNKRMAIALDKAKSHAAVAAQTGAYAVNRDFGGKDKDVWHASQALTLSSQDFDAVLALIGDLQGEGFLMSGLEFYLAAETLQSVQTDLTTAALGALRARAQGVAKDLGMTVDHYKSITIGNAAETSRPMPMRGFAAAAAPEIAPPVAQPGDATVSLTVTADIVLAPSKS
jgi:predicted secreted protein